MSVRLSKNDTARVLKARTKLLRWFSKYGRSFFWRQLERDPYRVLVTEFMLQQTQTFRAEVFLPKFLERFPTVRDLANADVGDVIKMWQGLGYNRRAINLHKSAQLVVEDFAGVFPKDEAQLLSLPGVGQYTSRAVQVFAFGKRVSVVDVNVARVLSRITKRMQTTRSLLPTEDVHTINNILLPIRAEKWHEALMDLGATICRAKPVCEQCPVKHDCASYPVLSNARHSPSGRNANERVYFGKPKRIWRGKVLKLVAEQDKITSKRIAMSLSTHAVNASAEFLSFVDEVIAELISEGFCRRSGAHITVKSS